MATPYDNLVALWHHWGRKVSNSTIDEFAQYIKQRAPAVTGLFIKTHQGAKWMAEWGDTSPYLGISGAASIDRWVETLAKYDMEFHAWCVPEGLDIAGEAQKMIDVASRPGVKSLILDVEPYAGFYQGPRSSVRPLMVRVRGSISGSFHIGISMDPRSNHYDEIFPDEWFPFVGSAHPQVYWRTFQQSPDASLRNAYNTWTKFKRPIYPVLQVVPAPTEMNAARSAAIRTYGATGISWWLESAVTDDLWTTLNVAIDGTVPTPSPEPGTPPVDKVPTGLEIVVKTTDARYRDGTYDGTASDSVLRSFNNERGWRVRYKSAEAAGSTVWARWDPQISKSGWYEISAYVPGQNATTDRARYKLHNLNNLAGETEVAISQSRYFEVWVPLGIYYLNADDPAAGLVFLNDLTGEKEKLIAFDAIRWRELGNIQNTTVADGFDPPIGSAADRGSAKVWPGSWFDATGFARRYRIGSPAEAYHTGADLNLNAPTFDADAHTPVYAAASGVVQTVRRYATWGYIIVIRHDPLAATGQVVFGRYAHIENPRVKEGQRVKRGDQIANVGNADGTQPYHLHFDISPTDILKDRPDHWPKLNLSNLMANYVDPRIFVSNNRPARR